MVEGIVNSNGEYIRITQEEETFKIELGEKYIGLLTDPLMTIYDVSVGDYNRQHIMDALAEWLDQIVMKFDEEV